MKKGDVKSDVTFAMFFSMWAVQMGWDVPAFHWQMIQFLDRPKTWKNNTAVLQVFRGGSKSTILGLWIVYMLVKDPTLRFLVLSADHLTAKKITADCLSIINRHPLAVELKGGKRKSKVKGKEEGTWQADRFFVKGSTDARNPSVAAHGINSNITSSRADYVVFDDTEVPKTVATLDLRESLRRKMSETNHILIPQTGRTLLVGTPHTYDSIYPETIKMGCSSLSLPLLDNPEGDFPYMTGQSRWEANFDDATVSQRQLKSKSRSEFLSQYQLIPMRIEDSILDPALLKVYEDDVIFSIGNGIWGATIGGVELASVTAFWDVALSKARGDDSVLAIVFVDHAGKIYVHRCIVLTGDVYEQCKQIAQAATDYNLPVIIVETNGIGSFVPQILLEATRNKGIGVDGRATTSNKGIRIIEAFETPLSGGFLNVSSEVYNSKFTTQIRDFSPKTMGKEPDDFIDSAASAISNEPIRIGLSSCPMTINDPVVRWRQGSEQFQAKMDYDPFARDNDQR